MALMMASRKTVTLAIREERHAEERHANAFVLIDQSAPLSSITSTGSDPEVQ